MTNPIEIIRQEQLVQLETLKKIEEVCQKYDIRYWVSYGTLLGAIRHKDFIPWDDDLDISMLREDYEKMCNIPEEEWGEDYYFCKPDSDDPQHTKLFPRVYKKNTRIQSTYHKQWWRNDQDNSEWSTNLWCDIFVYDHVIENDKQRLNILNTVLNKYRSAYVYSKIRPSLSQKNLRDKLVAAFWYTYGNVVRKMNPQHPWQITWKKICRLQDKGKSNTDLVGLYSTYDPFAYKTEDIFPLSYTQFNSIQVPIPKCWDQMLKDMYGDYMSFPPESERVHLEIAYLDLGNGSVYKKDADGNLTLVK